MQGPAFFLAQFVGDEAPFNELGAMANWLRPSSDPERKAAVADVRWQHPLPAQDAVPGKLAPRVGCHRLTCRRACSTDESTKSNGSTQDAAHIQPAGIRHARWLDEIAEGQGGELVAVWRPEDRTSAE